MGSPARNQCAGQVRNPQAHQGAVLCSILFSLTHLRALYSLHMPFVCKCQQHAHLPSALSCLSTEAHVQHKSPHAHVQSVHLLFDVCRATLTTRPIGPSVMMSTSTSPEFLTSCVCWTGTHGYTKMGHTGKPAAMLVSKPPYF